MSTKIFISQPMIDKTDEEVKNRRNEIVDILKNIYSSDIEILNSFIEDNPSDTIKNDGIWYLGKSLEILAQADMACFIDNWKMYHGCKIENEIAKAYGVKIIEYPFKPKFKIGDTVLYSTGDYKTYYVGKIVYVRELSENTFKPDLTQPFDYLVSLFNSDAYLTSDIVLERFGNKIPQKIKNKYIIGKQNTFKWIDGCELKKY